MKTRYCTDQITDSALSGIGGPFEKELKIKRTNKDMSMSHIRNFFSVPAKRGAMVRYTSARCGALGTIVGSRGCYLRVRWDVSGMVQTMHPTRHLEYLNQLDAS